METIARSPIRSCLLLLLISFGTLFFRLGQLPFAGSDEPRYARIAEEMLLNHRWVTPLLEGHPWLEKPPLYYWLTIPLYSALGVSETGARMAPAICALLTAITIWWLGRRLWTPLAGLYGGIILLTTLGFAAFGRSASTDMPLTACLALALALLCVGAQEPRFPKVAILSAYVFLGLAVLAKGPVAILLASGICALYWWLDERGGSFGRWQVLPGLMIGAGVSIPWFWMAFKESGYSFISVFFINQNLARYVSAIHHHTQPFYYYGPVLFGLMFPWSGWFPALWPGGLSWRLPARQHWHPGTLFLVCWIAFPFIFFSISQSKLPGYILPCLPPLSLLLGKRLAEFNPGNGSEKWPRIARWWYLIFSLGVAVSIPWLFQLNYGGRWQTGLWLALLVALPALVAFIYGRREKLSVALRCTIMHALILIIGITYLAFPALGDYHSTRNIARQALAARQHEERIVTYRFFHHTLSYYTGYLISGHLADAGALNQYALLHPRFLVIAEAARLSEFRHLPGFSATLLGQQGKLRLLRISHN